MAWTYYPIGTMPRALDIVWCRFPETNIDLGTPGPKPRPALVCEVSVVGGEDAAAGFGRVLVVYGTSRLKTDSRPLDFFVTNYREMEECGLFKATRFDLDQIAPLPWCREFFATPRGFTSPVIGHLTEYSHSILAEVIAERQRHGCDPRPPR